MDEQTNPANPQTTEETQLPVSGVPVMDVKAPSSPGVSSPTPSLSTPPAPAEPVAPTSTVPAEQTPTMSSPATPEPSPTASFGVGSYSPEKDQSQATQPTVQTPAQAGKKSGAKALKIILIVVIALLLAGGATYFYLKNQKAKESTDTNTPAEITQTTPAPVTSGEVSSVSNNLDGDLASADGANDMATTDLTDATLGL